MRQDVFTCLAVYTIAPHSQAAVEALPHLCICVRNRATPVRRQLNLTCAGLVKIILCGIGTTSLINPWILEAFFSHSMLNSYYAHCATLVPDWAGSVVITTPAALQIHHQSPGYLPVTATRHVASDGMRSQLKV